MLKFCYGIIGALVLTGALANGAAAQRYGDRGYGDRRGPQGYDRTGWEELGCVKVGRRADLDIIPVGRREGRFRAIRVRAYNNDVSIEDLKVVYGNGQPDDIRVRAVLREGDETRPIDLQGRDRFIDRVELVTRRDFRGGGRGPATVCVYGLDVKWDGPRGPQGPRHDGYRRDVDLHWEELGCAGVAFGPDHDVIPVGRREGWFKAIRLRAMNNDIEIENLRVIYANGEPDNIPVREHLRAGHQTRPLDLKGRGRRIDRVVLISQQDPKNLVKGLIKGVLKGDGRGIGKARVCVYGLQDENFAGNRRNWNGPR